MVNIAKQKVYKIDNQLSTIGYEGVYLEKYINRVIVEEIRVLCDVRKNAYSQKYGFSKTPLERACVGVVIQYIHISALGIESNKRQNLQSVKDYDVLFDEYEEYILSNRTDELSFIDNLLKKLSCCFDMF